MKAASLAVLLALSTMGTAYAQTTPATTPSATAQPTSQSADQYRSSKLVGADVYNNANEEIGEIDDLVVDAQGKVVAAVLSVGGFLGVGEKYVAVPLSALKLTREEDGDLKVIHEGTKESLGAMPAFTYYKS